MKRVRALLAEAGKRRAASSNATFSNRQGRGRNSGRDGGIGERVRRLALQVEAEVGRGGNGDGQEGGETVVLKASGRAIERVLSLGLYFQGQGDLWVRVRTGSVGVVDDVVVEERGGDEGKEGEEVEVPETRIRRTSVVEVVVGSKW